MTDIFINFDKKKLFKNKVINSKDIEEEYKQKLKET